MRERGWIKIKLAKSQTQQIKRLMELAELLLFCQDEATKARCAAQFRKSKTLRNVFSFAIRKNYGKDSFKVRFEIEKKNKI